MTGFSTGQDKVAPSYSVTVTGTQRTFRLDRISRNTAGQFTAGNTDRPKGSRNKATIATQSLLRGQAEALTQTSVTPKHWKAIALLCGCVWSVSPPLADQITTLSFQIERNRFESIHSYSF